MVPVSTCAAVASARRMDVGSSPNAPTAPRAPIDWRRNLRRWGSFTIGPGCFAGSRPSLSRCAMLLGGALGRGDRVWSRGDGAGGPGDRVVLTRWGKLAVARTTTARGERKQKHGGTELPHNRPSRCDNEGTPGKASIASHQRPAGFLLWLQKAAPSLEMPCPGLVTGGRGQDGRSDNLKGPTGNLPYASQTTRGKSSGLSRDCCRLSGSVKRIGIPGASNVSRQWRTSSAEWRFGGSHET